MNKLRYRTQKLLNYAAARNIRKKKKKLRLLLVTNTKKMHNFKKYFV